jgi:cell division protein FtsB
MLDPQNTEGRRNVYRRRQSGLALLFSGILLTVLAGAVVVISLVLQQTQRDLAQVAKQLQELATQTRPTEGSSRDAEAMQEWIATLRSEIAESRLDATKSITLAREEGRADRDALRKSLARVLHMRGATAEQVLSIVENLSASERARLQNELAALTASPPGPGAGSDPELTPIAPPEEASTPAPADPGTPSDGTNTGEPAGDPPLAVIVEPDTPDPGGGETAEPTGQPGEPAVTTYVIKRGDNLSRIARKLGVTEKALQEANGIRNPNLISVGATLKVPTE